MAKKRPVRTPKKLSIDVVETRAIVLTDEFGNERASLSCYGNTEQTESVTSFRINDDSGRPRLDLQLDSMGVGIDLYTAEGRRGISMRVSDRDGAGVSVYDYASDGSGIIHIGMPQFDISLPGQPRPNILVIDGRTDRIWSAIDIGPPNTC